MNRTAIILLALAVWVWASTRAPRKPKPAWAQHLHGWQKIFGVVAVFLTLLIVLNPEFLALGFLSDAAFFDMMVLVLSLQLHRFAVQTLQPCVNLLVRTIRWFSIPSPGTLYLLAVSLAAIAWVTATAQKVAQRLLS